MAREELVKALGQAVVARWGELPARVQQDLFEAAVEITGEPARDALAVFLHDVHPRSL
ncbi:MAG: hypothetical protein ACOY4R_07015 [Pseudomonadota bacterium]